MNQPKYLTAYLQLFVRKSGISDTENGFCSSLVVSLEMKMRHRPEGSVKLNVMNVFFG